MADFVNDDKKIKNENDFECDEGEVEYLGNHAKGVEVSGSIRSVKADGKN